MQIGQIMSTASRIMSTASRLCIFLNYDILGLNRIIVLNKAFFNSRLNSDSSKVIEPVNSVAKP